MSKTSATLYELIAEDQGFHFEFERILTESGGEVTPELEELEERWLSNKRDVERKLASYAKVIKNKEAEVGQLEAHAYSFEEEAKRLRQQAAEIKKHISFMSYRVLAHVDRTVEQPDRGPKRLKAENFLFQINRSGARPVIVDAPVEELPDSLTRGKVVVKGTRMEVLALLDRLDMIQEASPGMYGGLVADSATFEADKAAIKVELQERESPLLDGVARMGDQKLTLVIK